MATEEGSIIKKRHLIDRKQFTETYLDGAGNHSIKKWGNILFSEESYYSLETSPLLIRVIHEKQLNTVVAKHYCGAAFLARA